jgi:hypothetical protein
VQNFVLMLLLSTFFWSLYVFYPHPFSLYFLLFFSTLSNHTIEFQSRGRYILWYWRMIWLTLWWGVVNVRLTKSWEWHKIADHCIHIHRSCTRQMELSRLGCCEVVLSPFEWLHLLTMQLIKLGDRSIVTDIGIESVVELSLETL